MIQKLANLILGVHPNNTVFFFNWHNVRHINQFLKTRVQPLEGCNRILADIGGGKSPYYFHFSDRCSHYLVVDVKDVLPKDEQRNITQLIGIAENIPLENQSVDIVLCNQVLEHVIDPVRSVAEIHRILKPGGWFLGSVPHVSPVHLEPHDFRRFTSLGVEQILMNTGFEKISVEGNGGVFSTAALMILMDLLLSKRSDGKPQEFRTYLAVFLFPLVGFLNLTGLFFDKIIGDKGRTPANICWHALKDHTVP